MTEHRRLQYLMGTEVEIVVDAPDATARFAIEEAFRAIERVERLFSRFDASSDVACVNRLGAERPVEVSREVMDLVARGLRYAELSRGCFSIAVAPLGALWSAAADQARWPSDGEIALARELSDCRAVRVDQVGCTIAFDRPGMGLDLGGFAKGYAVDVAREALLGCGVERALISAGQSSIWAFERAGDRPWAVGVRHPGSESTIVGTLTLSNRALSTSGSSARGFDIAGRRYSHIIDPRTGTPLEGDRTATAVCDAAALAEVASKILLLEGCERGIRITDENGWDVEGAAFVADASEAGVWIKRSDGIDLDVWRNCA